ncbi:MAG: hypothetical protein RMY64_25385 [Nostoc sp. DedQUE08]|uniref:hypothetical protein n=1 Tax=unclassified Nostoc TaxID=2593658 RepID=UPI002AD44E54|nr:MULTISPECIES: hypothetical protein [unclassified Nostoc]MDZ8068927.1 hypothetical protein [Nostoc sp. DedQUE08]MDZ8095685.1 hypothetical protein [Nostoc sp. DedQUE05]
MNQLEEAQLAVDQQQQSLESQTSAVESQKQVIERQQRSVEAASARKNRALAVVNPSNAVLAIATEKIAEERATGEVSLARLNQEKKSLLLREIEIYSSINNAQKDLKQVLTELQKSVIRTSEAGTILKLELRNTGQVVRTGDAIDIIFQEETVLTFVLRKARLLTDF